MNYLCSYWLAPSASESRKSELVKYFDLQCYLKKRIGAKQIIVTNIDYPGAYQFNLPEKFTAQYGLFTRFYALGQMIEAGLEFPICCHDHDFFNATPLEYDANSILVAALSGDFFSDQVLVIPESQKQAILDFVTTLRKLDFDAALQSGYGTEVRHEGQFSTEQSYANIENRPFSQEDLRIAFNIRDQVSFDIVNQHSLEPGNAESEAIPDYCHGVHGHINKGKASDIMLQWLAKRLCS